MPDNVRRIAPEDPHRINIQQPWELAYWSNQFGVSEVELIDAVRSVGPMVVDVREYLEI